MILAFFIICALGFFSRLSHRATVGDALITAVCAAGMLTAILLSLGRI